jgi:hypothetical protein
MGKKRNNTQTEKGARNDFQMRIIQHAETDVPLWFALLW